ncbi:MAG: hypothetical protein EBY39_13015 [Flavobacteriia bacterium]|nr:hypothetical protein [Flavobacteriia bacterium]
MSNQTAVNGLDTNLFDAGGKLCFSEVEITGSPVRYTVTIDGDISRVGIINVVGNLANSFVVYEDTEGVCYIGNLKQSEVTNLVKA